VWRPGFTLLELLTVIGIMGLLFSMITPAVFRARERARQSYCANNLRELMRANLLYHDDYGRLVAAAADLTGANLIRWHGQRQTWSNAADFDYTKSALVTYLGQGGMVRRCPTMTRLIDPDQPGYEKGGGGYGYNVAIGTRMYFEDDPLCLAANESGTSLKEIRRADTNVMFADSACVVDAAGNHQPSTASGRLAENSFLQPPYYVFNRQSMPAWGLAWPTTHFRHAQVANVAWTDGHLSTEKPMFSNLSDWGDRDLGWFGPENNSWFDPHGKE